MVQYCHCEPQHHDDIGKMGKHFYWCTVSIEVKWVVLVLTVFNTIPANCLGEIGQINNIGNITCIAESNAHVSSGISRWNSRDTSHNVFNIFFNCARNEEGCMEYTKDKYEINEWTAQVVR